MAWAVMSVALLAALLSFVSVYASATVAPMAARSTAAPTIPNGAVPNFSVKDICLLGVAGLSDRKALYTKFLAISERENFTVYVPRLPCFAFEPAHNRFPPLWSPRPVSCSKPWSDYFRLPVAFALAPVLQPAHCTHDTKTASAYQECMPDFPCRFLRNVDAFNETLFPWPMDTKADSDNTIPFTCTEYKDIKLEGPFDMIHIRRGDILEPAYAKYHNQEHTAVANVVASYDAFAQAHNYTTWAGGHALLLPRTVLFSTDERDPAYLHELRTGLGKVARVIKVIHLDAELRRNPKCSDNYCVYCNTKQFRVAFYERQKLERRRGHVLLAEYFQYFQFGKHAG